MTPFAWRARWWASSRPAALSPMSARPTGVAAPAAIAHAVTAAWAARWNGARSPVTQPTTNQVKANGGRPGSVARSVAPAASAASSTKSPGVMGSPSAVLRRRRGPRTSADDGVGDAAAVDGGVAPGRAQGPDPLHPEVEVGLERVADGPVALEGDPGGLLGGI